MDGHRFDSLVRLLGTASSRRASLGVLVGATLAGIVGDAEARRKDKNRRDRGDGRPKDKDGAAGKKARKRDKRRATKRPPAPGNEAPAGDAVAAEAADCFSLQPGSNLNRCNFDDEDLSGAEIFSSSMRETKFRGADLCGADLSSSQLKDADFRGLSASNRTNLTRADLSSSGCNGTKFDANTVFCQTKTCGGAVNNRDCPSGAVCCETAECAERVCQTVECQSPACVYTEQPDGQPGNQCVAPRQCCDGECCGDGQTCCGGICIGPNDCCPACPGGETCLNGACCPNNRVCGGACLTSPCEPNSFCDVCDPDQGICAFACGPTQTCCLLDSPGPGSVCKQADLQLCESNDDCCRNEFLSIQSICTDEFSFEKICCRVEGSTCNQNFHCCSGSCTGSILFPDNKSCD